MKRAAFNSVASLPDEGHGFESLSEILKLLATNVGADIVRLGIDLGHGYHHGHYINRQTAVPSFLCSHRNDFGSTPPLTAAGWTDQRVLGIGTPGRRGSPRSGLILIRSPSRPAFKVHERHFLTQLLPHIACSITLAHKLESARQREACALDVLERARCGYLLLRSDGCPLHGNALAYDLLVQAHIRINQTLHFPTRSLQNAFDSALAHARGPSGHLPSTLVMPGLPPTILTVRIAAPLPPSPISQAAPFLLTLHQAPSSTGLPNYVAKHFGFTPAEFKLCAALIEGASLTDCSQSWKRSHQTLRSQLKAIFAKTDTHRQAELIALLKSFRAI